MVKIRHTGIVTKDLKKSLWFWKDQLNFKIKKRSNEKGKTIDSVLGYENVIVKTLKLEDKNKNLIELLFFLNPPKTKKNKILPYSIGIKHISITVKNLNALYKVLHKKKIVFNSKPKISSDGNVIMTYCETPEGAYLELVQEL